MNVQLGGAARPRYRAMEEFASLALIGANQEAIRRICVAFGPVVLNIETYGSALGSLALDPLRHAGLSNETAADLHLVMIDGHDTGFDGRAFSDLVRNRGGARRPDNGLDSERPTLRANIDWNTYCLIEEEKRRIIVWFADATAVPEWVVYDQIRNALHWLSFGRAFGMFHAAALLLGKSGCLIAGRSGSGKSTFTAAAIAGDFSSAGDDFVLVETATCPPRVHAVFDTIKLDENGLMWLPQYRPFVRNPVLSSTEKSIFHLYDSAPDRIATGFPLNAILHTRLTGQRQSRIVKSAPSAAFLALAPSSLLLLRTQGKDVSAKCATLVGGLDCYVFEIGRNLEEAVDELTEFMRDREQSLAASI